MQLRVLCSSCEPIIYRAMPFEYLCHSTIGPDFRAWSPSDPMKTAKQATWSFLFMILENCLGEMPDEDLG